MPEERAADDVKTNHEDIESGDSNEQVANLDEKSVALTPTQPVLDGGSRAWLQVVGSFLVFFNIWGFVFAFGSFQSYYELTYLPNVSASAISWIGTVQSFLLILIGVFSGPLFDLGYYRTMLFAGAAIAIFAVMMLSLCKEYYQMFLSQGICLGLGCGLLYLPGLALVGRSFKQYRAIAMGIVTCGAPTGGIVYTIVFDQLIGRLGFGWTVRVMGFIMIGSFLISFPLLLWEVANVGDIGKGTTRKLFDKTALRDIPFWSYTMANFFIFTGYLVPFFYISSFGQIELHMSRSRSLYTLVTSQAVSVAGRLIASTAAHHLGVMIPWITCGLCSGIFCIAWIGVHSPGAFIAFAALYGGFSGALIPLPPSIFPIVCPDPRVLGARLGMAQAFGSIASLIGAPIAGALAQVNTHGNKQNYLGLQLFSGLVMIFGVGQLVGLWIILVKKNKSKMLI